MQSRLLHIFKNTPLGREELLQSLYFCRKTGASPVVYLPEFTKFLMYFENDVIQVNLNISCVTERESARNHAGELLKNSGFEINFLHPKNFTSASLPDIPVHFDFMCCPWNIRDFSSKTGTGHKDLRVRRILCSAHFPFLITSPVYKPWNSVTVCFGGTVNAVKSLRLGLRIQRQSGLPLDIFTWAEGKKFSDYEEIVRNAKLEREIKQVTGRWRFFESGSLRENLYEIPHDALVILGASGHSLIHDIMFGSFLKKIQSFLSNNLLIAGHRYAASDN